ncbi:hypothetical protein [Aquimarina sp. AU474]|uniref:hypothetical protein n=1 Tax=Aquimarina sp. AU474 TaxID=2108529 RepID=UPI00135719FD|nr:hypothetical protein [Aquimarina sp. AU474]
MKKSKSTKKLNLEKVNVVKLTGNEFIKGGGVIFQKTEVDCAKTFPIGPMYT